MDSLGGANGVSTGGAIKVVDLLADAEQFGVLVHEWAHEQLHQRDMENRPPKTVRETEAESVAFAVAHALGLDTGTDSSVYIQLYNGDKEMLTASIERIQKTACTISSTRSANRTCRSLATSLRPTVPTPSPWRTACGRSSSGTGSYGSASAASSVRCSNLPIEAWEIAGGIRAVMTLNVVEAMH